MSAENRRTSQWVYDGVCPTCQKNKRVVVVTLHGDVICPPTMSVSCQCQVPVTTVLLVYNTAYEGKPIK